ncbi:MAG: hypothetical protein DKM50_04720 [Candidatus Margulisiibacteriota bacterium]|nr:MAG: hypothetical protein DKM50_04720 [Candidatus Margulisiibacteriota bacterium]
MTSIVAFHAQQCLEKSFKAILEEQNEKVKKIHDLEKLYNQVSEYVILKLDYKILRQLDQLYIEARYPGEMGLMPNGKPAIEDAQVFYKFSKDIYNQILNFLGGSDRKL